jgi:holin-like protein
VTAAVVLIHANGLFAAGLGVLILLSRYDVRSDDVLRVSLAGAAVILLGLLTMSAGTSIARGSALARTLVSSYLGAQLVVHLLVIAVTAQWHAALAVPPLLAVPVLLVLWLPGTAGYFVRESATA